MPRRLADGRWLGRSAAAGPCVVRRRSARCGFAPNAVRSRPAARRRGNSAVLRRVRWLAGGSIRQRRPACPTRLANRWPLVPRAKSARTAKRPWRGRWRVPLARPVPSAERGEPAPHWLVAKGPAARLRPPPPSRPSAGWPANRARCPSTWPMRRRERCRRRLASSPLRPRTTWRWRDRCRRCACSGRAGLGRSSYSLRLPRIGKENLA